MKKGCLFDLDGTLVNSLLDLALSANQVLENHGFLIHDIEEYNYFVGNGIRKLIERALPQDKSEYVNECLKEFQDIYKHHCLDHTSPYPGIFDLVLHLYEKGIKLGVVTNKPHDEANRIIEHLFPGMFVIALGQQDLYPIKPDPQSSLLALEKMGLAKDECYFIGDSNVDIQTGINVQMETIGVSWGFRGRKELEQAGATYVVDNPEEIEDIIDENRD